MFASQGCVVASGSFEYLLREREELKALLNNLDQANESEENIRFLNDKRRSSSCISATSNNENDEQFEVSHNISLTRLTYLTS